jgi:AraC-like DNA-binding protein
LGETVLGVVLAGEFGFRQAGRETTVAVGDRILFDSSRPFVVRNHGGAHLMLRVPRSRLPVSADPMVATRLPGATGIGALVAGCVREAATGGHRAAEVNRLFGITVDLLATLLTHELGVQDPPRQALLAQVHAFIQQHLGHPELSPAMVADAHHVSLRFLQQLFAMSGTTPAAWIRQRRLERCRHDLADPRLRSRPIHAIAARWGFTVPAHFSRLFRATYGLSPKDFRDGELGQP